MGFSMLPRRYRSGCPAIGSARSPLACSGSYMQRAVNLGLRLLSRFLRLFNSPFAHTTVREAAQQGLLRGQYPATFVSNLAAHAVRSDRCLYGHEKSLGVLSL